MRIESQDRSCFIELERREEAGYLLLDVAATLAAAPTSTMKRSVDASGSAGCEASDAGELAPPAG